jgi:hypothetical protein
MHGEGDVAIAWRGVPGDAQQAADEGVHILRAYARCGRGRQRQRAQRAGAHRAGARPARNL